MTITRDPTPTDSLELMFHAACEELAEARRAQRAKDTPAARDRVAECLTRLDGILDARNARGPGRPGDGPATTATGRPEPAGAVPAR